MIFDLMEAIDVLVTAIAIWIAAGVAALMLTAAGVAWGVRAVWRGVTGAWRRKRGPEAASDAREAHRGPQGPQEDFSYQEAA